MDLLATYERIIVSDLRPNLKEFLDEKGVEKLETDFYSFAFQPKTDDLEKTMDRVVEMMPTFRQGDTLELDIDEKTHKISVRNVTNADEEELINLDIPPPDDKKGEVYLRIIEDEFQRIVRALKAQLSTGSSASELQFLANKTIAKAKHLAHEAHLFKKRLSGAQTPTAKSSEYVMYTMKAYLIYVIMEVQILYAPFTGSQQGKEELEDELFEMQATKMHARFQKLQTTLNEKHLERLYQELPSSASLNAKIKFFRSKVDEKLAYIKQAKSVYVADRERLNLYLGELGTLLKNQLTEQLLVDVQPNQYKDHFEKLRRTQASILADKTSVEFQALSKTDFFEQLDIHVKLIQDLVQVKQVISRDELIKDIVVAALTLQSRAWVKQENQLNDYMTDLLRSRYYDVTDQTRQGRSGKRKNSGSLDLAIRDVNDRRIVQAIIESFILKSCGPSNKIVGDHLKRLTKSYDPAGNKESFALVFAKSKNFEKLWSSYKLHVASVVLKKQITDMEFDWFTFTGIKIGVTEIKRGEVTRRLYHVFVDMYENQ